MSASFCIVFEQEHFTNGEKTSTSRLSITKNGNDSSIQREPLEPSEDSTVHTAAQIVKLFLDSQQNVGSFEQEVTSSEGSNVDSAQGNLGSAAETTNDSDVIARESPPLLSDNDNFISSTPISYGMLSESERDSFIEQINQLFPPANNSFILDASFQDENESPNLNESRTSTEYLSFILNETYDGERESPILSEGRTSMASTIPIGNNNFGDGRGSPLRTEDDWGYEYYEDGQNEMDNSVYSRFIGPVVVVNNWVQPTSRLVREQPERLEVLFGNPYYSDTEADDEDTTNNNIDSRREQNVYSVADAIASIANYEESETGDDKVAKWIMEKMKCEICFDSISSLRCSTCLKGICGDCHEGVENSYNSNTCPYCRTNNNTYEKIVLPRF